MPDVHRRADVKSMTLNRRDNSITRNRRPTATRDLRVLFVLHSLARAGTEMLVAEFVLNNRDRLKSAVVCLDHEGPLAEPLRNAGIDVHHTHRQQGIDLAQIPRIRTIIRQFRPRVIHCHQYTPFFYGTLAASSSGQGRVIFTEHGCNRTCNVGWKRRAGNQFLARYAARITAVCKCTRSYLVNNEGIPAARIEVIYNGVDVRRFENTITSDQARRRLNLPANAPVIMQIGTFRPVKDQATAIRALHRLNDRQPHAILVFVGHGPDLTKCTQLAQRLGVTRTVRFLGQKDNVSEILPAADIVLATSLSEGHSVALLEAMAAKRPVLATRTGGNSELVIHNKTGLLVAPRDHHAVADALHCMIVNPALCTKMGHAGHRRVCDHFRQCDMHERYLQIYSELAAPGVQQ